MEKLTFYSLITLAVLAISSCTSQTSETQKARIAGTTSTNQTGAASFETVALSDPIICKKYAPTGSRLKTEEVCARESVWQRRQAIEEKGVRDFFDNANAGS